MSIPRVFAAAAALALAASSAHATPVTRGQWYLFRYEVAGGPVSGTDGTAFVCIGTLSCARIADGAWTYSTEDAFTVTVLDGNRSLDR